MGKSLFVKGERSLIVKGEGGEGPAFVRTKTGKSLFVKGEERGAKGR